MSGGPAPMRMPVWRLALADLAHDWQGTLVSVLAVTVALAPLLILFGLWFGIAETLRGRLIENPATREIRHLPIGALGPEWFETARARPDVGFLVPRTRYVNLQATLINRGAEGAEPAEIVLAPTAAGDPLAEAAGAAVPEGDAILLGERASEALLAGAGDRVTLVLARISPTGSRERVGMELEVSGVLPAALEPARKGFLPAAVLADIQSYQEWIRVPHRGWPGEDPRGDAWGGFRLYARTIDTVEPLRQWLVDQGFDVTSEAERIAFTKRVDRDLGALFGAIAGLTLVGFVATLGLGQVAAVSAKRGALGVLRLVGYRASALMWMPVIQGAALALAGGLLALGVYLVMTPVIGALFRSLVETEGALMQLPVGHAALGLAGAVAVAGLASAVAARRVLAIEPMEALGGA